MNAAEIDKFLQELDPEELRDPLLPAQIMVRWGLPPVEAEKVRRRVLARRRALARQRSREIDGSTSAD